MVKSCTVTHNGIVYTSSIVLSMEQYEKLVIKGYTQQNRFCLWRCFTQSISAHRMCNGEWGKFNYVRDVCWQFVSALNTVAVEHIYTEATHSSFIVLYHLNTPPLDNGKSSDLFNKHLNKYTMHGTTGVLFRFEVTRKVVLRGQFIFTILCNENWDEPSTSAQNL